MYDSRNQIGKNSVVSIYTKVVLSIFLAFGSGPLFSMSLEDATRIVRSLDSEPGGQEGRGRCAGCHIVNSSQIRAWYENSVKIYAECLEPQSLPVLDRIQCMAADDGIHRFKQTDSKPENVSFSAKKMGIFAAALESKKIRSLFETSNGSIDPNLEVHYHQLKAQASMPANGAWALSLKQQDELIQWVEEGLPFLDVIFPPSSPIQGCEESVSSRLDDYIDNVAQTNWDVFNRDNNMRMFGCQDLGRFAKPATHSLGSRFLDTLNCFTKPGVQGQERQDVFADGSKIDWTSSWVRLSRRVPAKFRILVPQLSSRYWVRSSPDGRYFGTSDALFDLNGYYPISLERKKIQISGGRYDPVFFPDGQGFSFLGPGDKPVFCPSNMIAAQSVVNVELMSAPCVIYSSMGPYLYLGASLQGEDYYALTGSHFNDDGQTPSDPSSDFSTTAEVSLTKMIFDGTSFVKGATSVLTKPNMGDWAMSPSGRMAVGRVRGGGYSINLIKEDEESGRISLDQVGRICMAGAKATISFNERTILFHHHVTALDAPDFGLDPYSAEMAEYIGTSNIYLYDIPTRSRIRVTTMKKGQRALFPHFRSDGWIYFLVNDRSLGKSYAMASDAAIRVWKGSE
ncbi:MAG: hypothetical protein NT027_16465 [Proteobacteria bacterium]|nr:hypothetical protein [Pseudomonadota bacterium]